MNNSRETILIVDDIVANIEILNSILGSTYEILFATSGQDAIDIAKEQLPDLILLDVVMPGMDGYAVCSRLKAEEKTRDIPVIFVTAMDHEEDESKGLNAGVIDYIIKPIRPSIVKARIHNHLELKHYRDYLKNLSTLDGLTGIPNRRRFDEVLQNEWYRGNRNQTTISLLMMDIDYFKAYNDNYGHLAGDECLRRLARCLSESVRRPVDLPARYGGEEFVLLLPETDSDEAVTVARRLQEKTHQLNIPHAYSQAADHVTFSIGIATMIPSDACSQLDLVNRADKLLYEAKHHGRNRFISEIDIKI